MSPADPAGRPTRGNPRPARRAPHGIAADPARRAAYDALRGVSGSDAYANLLLPSMLRERRLDPRDAAFATELAYGALRWQGSLDAVLGACVDRPLDEVDGAVLDVLRLGAYQVLHTRVPPHAAVAATVELARSVRGERPVRFVNAVLRKVAKDDWPGWVGRVAPRREDDEIGYLALLHGYPRWIAAAFADALGGTAELARALSDDRPRTHLVARPGRISRDELLEQVGDPAVRGPWSPYAIRMSGGDPASIPAVRDGRAAVQDEGSQLAALALTRGPLDGADRRWLDVCAGPGGKAALLAALLPPEGILLAADLHHHRARLVRQALAEGTRSLAVQADGTRPAWARAAFDRVLVDAPCSGLGALRRRPEARWRRTAADIAALGSLQRALLGSACEAARPGGLVAYVTCSPHGAETRSVVDDVVRERPEVEVLDARAALPGVADLGGGPFVQLWPHRHGTDAMFVALLRMGEPTLAPRPRA